MSSITRRGTLAFSASAPLALSTVAHAASEHGAARLAGKSILITGCSSGFGRLGALHYAQLGARVVASMRNVPRDESQTLISKAKSSGLDLRVVEIDVTSERSVSEGVVEAEEFIGGTPDILVNNAGIAIVGPLETQDVEATRLAYETNVIGYQRMIRAVLPKMRARKSGHIINMSSQSGRLIWPGLGNYCPTKFAVEAMSETLAYETALLGIDISIIQPGGYPTKFWENRERLTKDLKDRSDAAHLDGYGAMSAQMGSGRIPNLVGDPMDVPRAIADTMALPAGQRPLRVQVSSGGDPQETINMVNHETHLRFLGRGPFGDAARKVLSS